MIQRILARLAGYFFRGIVIVLPIAITIAACYAAVQWIDNLIQLDTPGMGLLVILGGVTAIGFLGSVFLTSQLIGLLDRVLQSLPLVKIIYSSIKDLTGAFVGENKRMSQPVLVRMGEGEGIFLKIGFMTGADLSAMGQPDLVSVYLPHSYNFSGELVLVPAHRVTPLDMPAAEAMKLVVSGGITGS